MTSQPVLLITGGSGYIGRHLLHQTREWQVHATWFNHAPPSHPHPDGDGSGSGVTWHRLDVCDEAAVYRLFTTLRPRAVIHTAYQFNTPAMERVIVDGTRHVAQASAQIDARLVHLSTDVVFDGRRGGYRETDTPNPVHAYGQAKVIAEGDVTRRLPNAAIVRTSLVYGFDPPDPRTAWTLDTARQRGPITLFTDEFRCPIFVVDLADAILEVTNLDFAGIIHIAGPEVLSRYEFGVLLCQAFGVDPTGIQAALTASSGLVRPLDCSLDITLARTLLHTPLHGVRDVLHRLKFFPSSL